jgi:hypothetical protein
MTVSVGVGVRNNRAKLGELAFLFARLGASYNASRSRLPIPKGDPDIRQKPRARCRPPPP